jgi:uncharacterized protein YyaL (SSP411 family)
MPASPRPARRRRAAVAVAALLATACGGPATPASPTPDATPVPATATPAASASRSAAEIRAAGNHLVGEASPYLLQHAHNPIDWYPWSSEVLARAKAEGKPIFVSIGYATCHWCHVMERESFDDDAVADFLNAHFVAIKVDREQRPDIDALYLAAVAALGGDTGWPLNVFLTPDGVPIVGGTYFPREPDGRRPGFLALAEQVQAQWAADGPASAKRGEAILEALGRRDAGPARAPTQAELDTAMQALARHRDEVRGGFGSRQKFPNVPVLLAALRWSTRGDDDDGRRDAREHVHTTLTRMRDGGLRDAVAGSFHRYCVDPQWRIPHFEKTLYDNALLALLYLEASQRLAAPEFAEVARGILDDLVANWQVEGGGFIVGFDADDANGEGTYYTWTRAELDAALGPSVAADVAAAYDVAPPGDPELGGRSVLRRAAGIDDATLARAQAALPTLARARASRPAPAKDDKILVAWNALAIEALVEGARVLGVPRYREVANDTAAFLDAHAQRDGALRRGTRRTESGAWVDLGAGFADDHALLARALLRLHGATGEFVQLREAHSLAGVLYDDFFDAERGGIRRVRAGPSDAPITTLDMDDQAVPSAGAVTTQVWLELGALSGDDRLWAAGDTLLSRWQRAAGEAPMSSGTMLATTDAALAGIYELVIAGAPDDAATIALVDVAATADRSRLVVARVGAEGVADEDATGWPGLTGKRAQGGKPTAYLCTRGTCRMPTADPAQLRAQLLAAGLVAPP